MDGPAREREERPGISAASVNTPRPRKPLVSSLQSCIPPTRKVERKGGEKNEKIRETKRETVMVVAQGARSIVLGVSLVCLATRGCNKKEKRGGGREGERTKCGETRV